MLNHNLEAGSIVFMVTIVNRDHGERISHMFAAEGVTYNLLFHGRGTANSTILNYFGLGETEKDLIISTLPYATSQVMLNKLSNETNIKKPGHGIAFTMLVSSVCGARADKCLRGASELDNRDISVCHNTTHELIIAITNRGYVDEIMEAARNAKATGGTVFHARRIGLKEAESFFGVSIEPEKEILLILANRSCKQDIMQAITARAGLQTEAKTVVFSLPVNDVIGLADAEALSGTDIAEELK